MADLINFLKRKYTRHQLLLSWITGVALYFIFRKQLEASLLKPDYINNIMNLSGVFIGFMLTTLGFLISLRRNKFTVYIVKSGTFKRISSILASGMVSFFISLLAILFDFSGQWYMIFFICGLVQLAISTANIFSIINYTAISD